MNLKNLTLMAIAAIFFAACESEEKTKTETAIDITGTYEGYTLASFSYSPNPIATDNETIKISKNSDGTVAVDFKSTQWGDFNIPSAKITEKDEACIINGQGKTIMGMSADSKKEYECTLVGAIDKKNDKAGFTFNVPAVMGGLDIEFYKGKMPDNYAVTGTYNGNMELSVAGNVVANVEEAQFSIVDKDGSLLLNLKGFGMGQMQIADLNSIPVKLEKEEESFKITGTIDTESNGIKISGNLAGTIAKDGNTETTFTLRPGAMPMDVVAKFKGKK